MHTKTLEGLAGASMSMKLMDTPLRVYKEAERRGDTAVMERTMGYAGDFADKAEDYQNRYSFAVYGRSPKDVSSILSFMFLRKREGRKEKGNE